MRKEFKMTEEQYTKLIKACQPVPYMIFGGQEPRSPQENANAVWCDLGRELGFKGMTVQPSEKGKLYFTAEVNSDFVEAFLDDIHTGTEKE